MGLRQENGGKKGRWRPGKRGESKNVELESSERGTYCGLKKYLNVVGELRHKSKGNN